MENYEGRTAVITGAGGGIGSAIAKTLAAKGINIILLGGKRVEKLNALSNELQALGVKAKVYGGDMTDTEWLIKRAKEISESNQIDILINNAGIAQSQKFTDITQAEYDAIMNINAKAPFFLTQALLPNIKKSDKATVINIASVVAHAGYPLQSAYTASKHALLGFTKSLSAEVYQDGVRVHAICPGGVYTDMVKISRPDLTAEGMIMPQDIANIVWFFLENRGNAVVDEILVHRANKQPFLV